MLIEVSSWKTFVHLPPFKRGRCLRRAHLDGCENNAKTGVLKLRGDRFQKTVEKIMHVMFLKV